jgi:Mlc titration factor MtfA (ptsG expression regulator)
MDVDSNLKLLVAAPAATLSLGWQGYKWTEVAEVLIYPDYFDHDFTIGPREVAGLADLWGTVIICAPALWYSFEHSEDAYHVGLHEFGHLLTYEQGRNAAIPRGLRTTEIQEWVSIQNCELKKVRRGRSVVNTLGRDYPEEFFPSAVEAFFEKPIPLKQQHRRLYAYLRKYFGQDPAVWELKRSSAMNRDGKALAGRALSRNRSRR